MEVQQRVVQPMLGTAAQLPQPSVIKQQQQPGQPAQQQDPQKQQGEGAEEPKKVTGLADACLLL